jgi:NADPH-dependent 2,4-dienoyl-CoA reductase/sulfur reductase-like enzyme
MKQDRRAFLALASALGLGAYAGNGRAQEGGRVVVVGGGFGGATCARYLKVWRPQLEVTLVEPQPVYVACPMSNRVLAGTFDLRDITRDYGFLAADYNIRVIRASANSVDPSKRVVALSNGTSVPYDRLVLAPGVDFAPDRIGGLRDALASQAVLHAWRGGARQVTELRNRIAEMKQGGVVALHVPKAPFRCPPGPYERVSLIAHYLSRNNPTAKLLLFDANPDILAKRDLFMNLWKGRYPNIVEYVPNADLTAVSNGGRRLEFAVGSPVNADVVNVVPPQRAAELVRRVGLVPADGNWAPVDFLSYESTVIPGIHVIGDSIQNAPGLPKSGHMANQAGKVCAAAIAARFAGQPPPQQPVIANTCYSFVSNTEAMHVAGVFRYDGGKRTMVPVQGAGGLSKAPSATEAVHAFGWAFNILHDTFGGTVTLQAPTTSAS